MDTSDLDQESYERRKRDVLEYRNRKRFSSIFVFCCTVFETVLSVVLVFGLVMLGMLICTRLVGEENPAITTIYPIVLLIALVGGIVGGFFIYKATARAVIKKWNLEEKLSKDVLYHYKTKKEIEDQKLEEMHK